MKLYCNKCRSDFGHAIARGKKSKTDYQDVSVLRKINDTTHSCRCNVCGHKWNSKSKAIPTLK